MADKKGEVCLGPKWHPMSEAQRGKALAAHCLPTPRLSGLSSALKETAEAGTGQGPPMG